MIEIDLIAVSPALQPRSMVVKALEAAKRVRENLMLTLEELDDCHSLPGIGLGFSALNRRHASFIQDINNSGY